MPFSFNCFNHSTYFGLPPSLPQQVKAAAAAGYDDIGLDLPSLAAHDAAGLDAGAIRALLDESGIRCYELVPLPVGLDQSQAVEQLDTVERFARAVGARHVLATARLPGGPAVVEQLRRATDRLGANGTRLSIEFMASSPLRTLEQAIDVLDSGRLDDVGAVVDTWHACLSGGKREFLEQLPVERIGFVQLADAPRRSRGDDLDDSLHRRLLPGQGDLPLAEIRALLAGKGYSGVVSVEVLSRSWRHRPIEEFTLATLRAAKSVWEPGSVPDSRRAPAHQESTPSSPRGHR